MKIFKRLCALALAYTLLAGSASFAHPVRPVKISKSSTAMTRGVNALLVHIHALAEDAKLSVREDKKVGGAKSLAPQPKRAHRFNLLAKPLKLKAAAAKGKCACAAAAAIQEGGGCFADCLGKYVSPELIEACMIACGSGPYGCAACLGIGVLIVAYCYSVCNIAKNERPNLRKGAQRSTVARKVNANRRPLVPATAG